MNGHQLGSIWKGRLYLHLLNKLWHTFHNLISGQYPPSFTHKLRNRFTISGSFKYRHTDISDRLRVIQFYSPRQTSFC